MKKVKKILSLLLISALVISTFSGCSSAKTPVPAGNTETIQLKLGMVDPASSNYYKGMMKVAEEVSTATNGKVKITVYPSSQLGNERDMYEGCQLGSIDMTSAANSVMTAFIPEMGVLDQPFLFDSAEQANKVIDGKLGEKIAEKAAAQGVHVLGWMESGFRDVFSNRPIQKLEDFKGLKIRVMENDVHIAAFNALGAIATPMAAGDQFIGFQQKTIDAAENAIANFLANKFYEVIKNITRSQHLFVFIGISISDKAWKRIPDDLKDAFAAAVKKGCIAQRQYLVDANKDAEIQLVAKGVKFFDIDRAALKAAVAPAMKPFRDKMPQEWLDIIEEAKK